MSLSKNILPIGIVLLFFAGPLLSVAQGRSGFYELFLEITPFAIVFAIISLVIWLKKRTPQLFGEKRYRNMPVLLRTGVKGEGLINVHTDQTPAGHNFSYMVNFSLFSSETAVGSYIVELPFTAGVHLVGIPKEVEVAPLLSIDGAEVEEVVLEGDYPNYFTLYADTEQQRHSRYVLDPSAMEFTVDFCRIFAWEILDDTLYFLSTEALPSLEIVDKFIEQIRPAVQVESPRRTNPHRMPYNNFKGRVLLCPVCSEQLQPGEHWLACPNGHGCMVTGGQLRHIRVRQQPRGVLSPQSSLGAPSAFGQPTLQCPYCSASMHSSEFYETGAIIDVCERCMFRWLSVDDFKAILGRETLEGQSGADAAGAG